MIDKIILYNINHFGLFNKDYEQYLLDFLNNSKIMKQQYGVFKKPLTECHGEDDANSLNYSIDFKRFITQDECRYKRLNKIETLDIISLKDESIKTNCYYDMLKCMKSLTIKDFYNIKNKRFTYINEQEEREYTNIINRLLMKEKNIMVYLPKIVLMQDNTLDEIITFLNFCLKNMFEFRTNNVNKDLYFSFIICKNINKLNKSDFIITKYNKKLDLIDIVPTKCSSNFMNILN